MQYDFIFRFLLYFSGYRFSRVLIIELWFLFILVWCSRVINSRFKIQDSMTITQSAFVKLREGVCVCLQGGVKNANIFTLYVVQKGMQFSKSSQSFSLANRCKDIYGQFLPTPPLTVCLSYDVSYQQQSS